MASRAIGLANKAKISVLSKFSLSGRTVVVTGGGRGLGLNFCNALAQAGANIAAIDVHSKAHEEFSVVKGYGGKAMYYKADVRDHEGLKDTIDGIAKDFGGIHGCVAAAGIIRDEGFFDHSEQSFRDTMDVNVTGVFNTVQHCARHMKAQETGGSIVCIASLASYKPLKQGITAYGASKWAVRGMTKQIASEVVPYGIRCNSISPGPMRTNMLEKSMSEREALRKSLLDGCMMGRLGDADELNGALVYLMSDAASYVTGEDILIDGGML